MAVFSLFAYGTNEHSAKTHSFITEFQKACIDEKTIIEGPNLLGLEIKKNAKGASNKIIDSLTVQEDLENNINLTGFSRGSVICIHIANLLKLHQTELDSRERTEMEEQLLLRLKALSVHIFAMDPVAGWKDKSDSNARLIPSNVKSYVAILQL